MRHSTTRRELSARVLGSAPRPILHPAFDDVLDATWTVRSSRTYYTKTYRGAELRKLVPASTAEIDETQAAEPFRTREELEGALALLKRRKAIFVAAAWVFGAAALLIPLLSGFMRYRYLPNESFDPKVHVLLDSIPNDNGPEKPTLWESRATGEMFDRTAFGIIGAGKQFESHFAGRYMRC